VIYVRSRKHLFLVSLACDGCYSEGPRVTVDCLPEGAKEARLAARALSWLPAYHGRDWCADCARREVRS
jgi:hypothetical protein